MKKILSVILMLAVLIAPAGATLCFADKGVMGVDQYLTINQIVDSMGLLAIDPGSLGNMKVVADVNGYGMYSAKVYFYSRDGRALGVRKLSEGSFVYKKLKEYVAYNYFSPFDTTLAYDYFRAKISVLLGFAGQRDRAILTEETYDGITKSKETKFYSISNLEVCPRNINKLEIWHQLICIYAFFTNPA